jgi:hypothetical protein
VQAKHDHIFRVGGRTDLAFKSHGLDPAKIRAEIESSSNATDKKDYDSSVNVCVRLVEWGRRWTELSGKASLAGDLPALDWIHRDGRPEDDDRYLLLPFASVSRYPDRLV